MGVRMGAVGSGRGKVEVWEGEERDWSGVREMDGSKKQRSVE